MGWGHDFEQSREYQFGLHCAQRQRGLKALQFGMVSDVAASAPQSPDEHVEVFVLVSILQMRPFSGVQSSLYMEFRVLGSSAKHEQLSVFGKFPFVFLHVLNVLQTPDKVLDLSQYFVNGIIQFELPQRHSAELAVTPSELLHGI